MKRFSLFCNALELGARGALLAVALSVAASPVAAKDIKLARDINETIVQVPVQEQTPNGIKSWSLVGTTYHPPGNGPFPLIVLNHGSPGIASERAVMGRWRHLPQIREFTKRGFAVLVPMRRGYGATGGDWAENFGTCKAPIYYHAALEQAKDVTAAIRFGRSLPFVNPDEVILVGQSAGGIASIAAASKDPEGLIGVVNFSGGRGGRPYTNPGEPCVADNMTAAIAKLAKTIKVPVLWHYSENDQFFAPHNVKAWFRAFKDAGAHGRLVMQPPFQWDGHGIFGMAKGLPIWTAQFDKFLTNDIHFTTTAMAKAGGIVPASLPGTAAATTAAPAATIPAAQPAAAPADTAKALPGRQASARVEARMDGGR